MQGRELAQEFATEAEAAEALERLAAAKRRRGYRDR
jgi:predicted DNA-binding WGR domain protein